MAAASLIVEENLAFSARIRDIPEPLYRRRRDALLEMAGLQRFTGRPAGQLSGGMRKKLSLCANLIHQPPLLILDEPGLGVDPLSRRQLWDMLDDFREAGVTQVVATSYMDEAERCDRVLLLHEGRILADGSPADLRAMARGRVFELSGPAAAAERLHGVRMGAGLIALQRLPGRLRLLTRPGGLDPAALGLPAALRLRPAEPVLDDLFVLAGDGEAEAAPIPAAPVHGEAVARDAGMGGLSTDKLSVRFGDFQAVKQVSLDVPAGELLALLGPNGAGKTTLIRALCGLVPLAAGAARVGGVAVEGGGIALRRRVGYMSQRFSLYLDLTPRENLQFFANAYGLHGEKAREALRQAQRAVALDCPPDKATGALSAAVRQRLALACSILHRPAVLFLDEPTSGVDPASRYRFWRLIREFADSGLTVLVTTHYLDEALYCDRLALMMDGRLIAQGGAAMLKREYALPGEAGMEDLFLAALAKARTQAVQESAA
jgi:ABC-2 type transport system ATP-binding protein